MRSLRFAAVVVVTAFAALAGSGGVGAGDDPATIGQWSEPVDWPVTGIHSALFYNGDVINFAYPFEGPGSEAWTAHPGPVSNGLVEVPVGRDLFCAGHAFLPDGSLAVFGGNDPRSADPFFYGTADVHRFDPVTGEWTRLPDMRNGRWYPTATVLPDGKVLISSGLNELNKVTSEFEVFDPDAGETRLLEGADRYPDLYPWMFVLPDGGVLHSGPEDVSMRLDVAAGEWSEVAASTYGYRESGTAAMLPLRPPEYRPRIMQIGGADPATNTAEIVDLGASIPAWAATEPMTYPRRHANATLLPDGTVLVSGGTIDANEADLAIRPAETYDPESGKWTEMAPVEYPRIYHSTAILLPDGRVMTSGGDDELTAEFFSPPYLFRGDRPQITRAPGGAVYGGDFEIETSGDVSEIVLMRPGSVTHSFNQEQRLIELEFEASSGKLSVEAPPSGNIAPPGYYMLFALDADGVPSEAKFIRIGETTDGSLRGDIDCDGDVDVTDGLALLRHTAGLPVQQGAPCPEIGSGDPVFGDLNCDGLVDPIDALVVLRHAAGLELLDIPECVPRRP